MEERLRKKRNKIIHTKTGSATSMQVSFNNYVGIKKVVFGGSEFESWKENMTSEETGFRVHKI